MKVELIDSMGSDLTVVNAARVSFDKHHEMFDGEGDARLIRYLARHRHWTPFAHPQIQFRVTAPLFVAAQLKRHVVGAALNEVSRRYVDDEPGFEALRWRTRPEKRIKQGSAGEFDEDGQVILRAIAGGHERLSVSQYGKLLEIGVAPEQARSVLPQTMHTSWYWTGSLYFWANLCEQRLDAHAQAETRWVATEIARHASPLFPVSWKALMHAARLRSAAPGMLRLLEEVAAWIEGGAAAHEAEPFARAARAISDSVRGREMGEVA